LLQSKLRNTPPPKRGGLNGKVGRRVSLTGGQRNFPYRANNLGVNSPAPALSNIGKTGGGGGKKTWNGGTAQTPGRKTASSRRVGAEGVGPRKISNKIGWIQTSHEANGGTGEKRGRGKEEVK